MELALRGLGDSQADCIALKMRDPVPGATPTCTPQEVAEFLRWQAGAAADYARTSAAEASNPATILIGAMGWASPSTQISALTSGRSPFLYYVGAALPFVLLYWLAAGGKR